jgi:hypothetical protein
METTMWKQGWLSSADLGLDGELVRHWELFVAELHRAHIRLCENFDELIWGFNKQGGYYTAKLGYQAMFSVGEVAVWWWWKTLWKVKAPPKSKFLMWLSLSDKVLTWDLLQRRGKVGPSRCPLCKLHEESNSHIFLHCSYSCQVWREVEGFLGFDSLWHGLNIEACFQSWFSRKELDCL